MTRSKVDRENEMTKGCIYRLLCITNKSRFLMKLCNIQDMLVVDLFKMHILLLTEPFLTNIILKPCLQRAWLQRRLCITAFMSCLSLKSCEDFFLPNPRNKQVLGWPGKLIISQGKRFLVNEVRKEDHYAWEMVKIETYTLSQEMNTKLGCLVFSDVSVLTNQIARKMKWSDIAVWWSDPSFQEGSILRPR